MSKVVTFGELMLRLAPNGYYRFFQNDQMQATFGGGEANVAVSIANYGLDSVYVTKLPKHAIGQAAVDSLRYFGVDTSKIVRGGVCFARVGCLLQNAFHGGQDAFTGAGRTGYGVHALQTVGGNDGLLKCFFGFQVVFALFAAGVFGDE